MHISNIPPEKPYSKKGPKPQAPKHPSNTPSAGNLAPSGGRSFTVSCSSNGVVS